MNAEIVWNNLKTLRYNSPLVHNITNYVVMNNTANALLAIGASPIMAHAVEEVEDMVSISGTLVINIGTLSKHWVDAMKLALKKANFLKKPVVLDPVGAGASAYRNQTLVELFQSGQFALVRGNASEIKAIADVTNITKGVDSDDSAESAINSARLIQQKFGSTVCITGAVDLILDNNRVIKIYNGHPMMKKVTGMGCTASAINAAFLASSADSFQASASAMVCLGIAGELAAAKSNGPGSLQLNILDALYNLSESDITKYMRIEI